MSPLVVWQCYLRMAYMEQDLECLLPSAKCAAGSEMAELFPLMWLWLHCRACT